MIHGVLVDTGMQFQGVEIDREEFEQHWGAWAEGRGENRDST